MKTICSKCYQLCDVDNKNSHDKIICPNCSNSFRPEKVKYCVECGTANLSEISKCRECGTLLKMKLIPVVSNVPEESFIEYKQHPSRSHIDTTPFVNIFRKINSLIDRAKDLYHHSGMATKKKIKVVVCICIAVLLILCIGIPAINSARAAYWDKEAFRIVMAIEPSRDENFMTAMEIIDDWRRNMSKYTSRGPTYSEEVQVPFRRYRTAKEYVCRRILAIAPEHGIKGKYGMEVETEIYFRVIRLCGSY